MKVAGVAEPTTDLGKARNRCVLRRTDDVDGTHDG